MILKVTILKLNLQIILFIWRDILDEEKLKVALSQSQEKLGPIKGLVNCAALDFIPNKKSDHNLENFDIKNFSNIFNINVSAQILVSKLVAEKMISQKYKDQ